MKLLNKNLILTLVITLSVGILLTIASADSRLETKGSQLIIENPAQSGGFFAASASINNNEVISQVINTTFPFNAISFSWQETEPIDFDIYVRFEKESWTEWQKLEEEVDFKDEAIKKENITRIFFTPYTNIFQYKFVFQSSADKNKVNHLIIDYIDSTKGTQSSYNLSTVQKNGLKIIPRQAWGADESFRFDETGQEIWPREYYTPKKFVIHHTASSDVSNPAATVRAIYYWHAKSNGWGDIGYNYLIDPQGNIYEGRAGGDGVVGGHAYMNNRNTIGIAILGCYQPGKGCNTATSLTPQTQAALAQLIAVKSQLFEIDPIGNSDFGSYGSIKNVLGHRDLNSTNCPGDNIYQRLSDVRNSSKIKLASLTPLPKYETKAQLLSISQKQVEIPEGEMAQITVRFKNVGQATWRGYEDNYLLVSSEAKKLGQIGGLKFASHATKPTISGFKMQEGNVAPGEVGTFILTLPAKDATENFMLAWNGYGYFPGTEFTISTKKIKRTTLARPTQTPKFTPVYLALIENTTIPERIPANTSKEAQIKFYNLGNVTWKAGDLKLLITTADGTPSPLLEKSEFLPQESSIAPNQSASFKLTFKADNLVRQIPHRIVLQNNSTKIIGFSQVINVVSPYAGVIIEQNFPVAVKNTWRPTVKMTIKNVGSKPWKNPTLKSTDIDGTLSWFYDKSWIAKKTVMTKWTTVNPGEEVTFEFKIKPYWKPNTYPHVYKLWTGDQAITLNGQEVYERLTRIDP